ncbi:cyclin-like protein [Nitzschia inconspicua]|uniref:Cyclin-like protein n=1 Tax=Nitzschia inconspicua TaxID=303405 RepID=A0A9K3PGL3_9STRA|nr:cyclin-like protein [Nitzschia inconspicua]
MMRCGTTSIISDYEVNGEFTFKPIQPWDRVSTPTQSMQRMSMATTPEKTLGSKPYGIETMVDDILCVSTEDLYQDMKERQVEYVSPSTYAPNASYLPYRRYLVDWMSDVGEQCRLHNSTVHVGILFLDKIFRCRNIPRNEWQLLATACISVAAKYEEAEEHCPPIPELLRLTKLGQGGHTPLSFREGELSVLRYLNWELRAIPAIHVIGYYLSKGSVYCDDTWQGRTLIEKIPRYVKKYAEFFCNLTLQEYAFQQYLPTHLAAAILYASRVALQIEPRWRPELCRLTGYKELEVVDVFQHVWSYYEEQFPGHGSRAISPRSVTYM